MQGMFKGEDLYYPILVRVLIKTNYQFKYRNSGDLLLRKNIALLLNEVVKSIPAYTVHSLELGRRIYLNALLLSPSEVKRASTPSAKFPD
jgi:hypothetical protein